MVLPITIIGSIVILIVFDEYIRTSTVSSVFLAPADILHFPLNHKYYSDDGMGD